MQGQHDFALSTFQFSIWMHQQTPFHVTNLENAARYSLALSSIDKVIECTEFIIADRPFKCPSHFVSVCSWRIQIIAYIPMIQWDFNTIVAQRAVMKTKQDDASKLSQVT